MYITVRITIRDDDHGTGIRVDRNVEIKIPDDCTQHLNLNQIIVNSTNGAVAGYKDEMKSTVSQDVNSGNAEA